MSDLRNFSFMESWLDDIKDWDQEDKNEAIWRIINYGIYREVDWDSIPKKEQAWYNNVFRVIDKGSAIKAANAERGSAGGKKNHTHPKEKVEEALLSGCITAKEVADYCDGTGSNPSWVFKNPFWVDRVNIWKNAGIPVDSKGNPNFSNGKLLESNGIQLDSTGKVLENKQDSNGIKWEF